MIKLKDILNEAPLGTYTTIGGFGPYGSKTIATTQNLAEAQEKLDSIANTIPYLIEDVLGASVGDIFVM